MADFEMNKNLAIPLSMLSDAGAWLVRLSGPLRTSATEEGFQKWLRESPLHSIAFRQVSAEWDEADRLRRYTDVVIGVPGGASAERRLGNKHIGGRSLLAVAAVLVAIAVAGLFHHLRPAGIATGINELRVVTLDDGSRVHLNTSTRITVAYDEAERRIRLDAGEALFEVAKHSAWPFVVTAGDRKVSALGTAFLVRHDPGRVAVTLMDGQVAISPTVIKDDSLKAPVAVRAQKDEGMMTLTPGERVTFFEGRHGPEVDRPQVSKLLAWQRGRVAIDNMPLAAAVAEMNRYSPVRLVLEQPQSDDLLVSGVFMAGQSMSFARAIEQSYGLRIVDHGSSIVLAGVGRSAVNEPGRPAAQ